MTFRSERLMVDDGGSVGTLTTEQGIRLLEARAEAMGIEPIARLHAQRAALVDEVAPLRALRDTFDARRKERRGAILALIEHERAQKGEKPLAATMAETVASGDARYRGFLDECALAFARLAILEDRISAVSETIMRDQALLRLAANEPR